MLHFFTPTNKNISDLKQIIKEQTCQDKLRIETIKQDLSKFDFGYISYGIKAKSGRRSPRNFSDNHILDGFILCSIIDDDEAMIEIVCSRKNSKIGKTLMETTEEFLKETGITRVTLYSLPEEKLKQWYEKQGYNHLSDIYFSQKQKSVIKVHIMRKKL